jgi:hypothetical protein
VIVGTAVSSVSTVALFPRLLGAAIILLGLAFHHRDRLTRLGRLAVGLAAISLLGLSELARRHEPGWWLAVSNDATFFESLGWSLAKNGPHAHPGFSEGTIFGYHYLAYAVSGAITELSGAPPYYVLNVLLPWLLLTSLSLVLFPFLLRRTQSFAVSTGLVVVFASILKVSSATSFLFSNWAISVYAMLLLELRREDSRSLATRHQALLAIVAFIAVFGKATALPVVMLLGLWSSLAGQPKLFELRPKELLRSIPWHLAPAGFFFIVYFLPSAPDVSREGESAVLRALLELPNNEGLWQSRFVLGDVVFFVSVSLVALTTRRPLPHEVLAARELLLWLSAAGAIFLLLIPNAVQRAFVAKHAGFVVLLLMLIITAHPTKFEQARLPNRATALSLIVLAILGFASFFAVFRAPSFSQSLEILIQDPRGRWAWFAVASLEGLLPTIVVLIATTWRLIFARKYRISPRADNTVFTVFSLSLGLVLCLSVANAIENHPAATRNTDATAAFDASYPDAATSEVGDLLRSSTPRDAIVASNSFCCSGNEWLTDALGELQEFTTIYGLNDFGEKSYGGANYQLVSVSRRQFLLAGPRFLVNSDNAGIVASRLEASVLFGATGSNQFAAELRKDGAGYFVVDKAALGSLVVPTFEQRLIFANSRYLVLDLAN